EAHLAMLLHRLRAPVAGNSAIAGAGPVRLDLEDADQERLVRDPAGRERVGEDEAPPGLNVEQHPADRFLALAVRFTVGAAHDQAEGTSLPPFELLDGRRPGLRAPPFGDPPGH